MSEPTPPLDEFREAYDKDDNIWWAIGCGHHQNLFDAACERIDALETQRDRMDKEHARAICEALGEPYEPSNRDEWQRSFDEVLPHVRARTNAWRALLTRIEFADPEWLDKWRRNLAKPPETGP